MPKVSPRKIKSALKRPNQQLLIVVAAVIILAFAAGIRLTPRHYVLRLGGQSYQLEVARTEAAQEKGLGGRTGLAPGTGMLFVFDKQTDHCFWMKDMRFNIDIIWADITKHVTGIEPDLAPATYPHDYCHLGKYVLELPAGTAAANKLQLNEPIHF